MKPNKTEQTLPPAVDGVFRDSGGELIISFGGRFNSRQDENPLGSRDRVLVFQPGRDPGKGQGNGQVRFFSDINTFNQAVVEHFVHGDFEKARVDLSPEDRNRFPDETTAFLQVITGAQVRRGVIDRTNREKGFLFLNNLTANFRHILESPLITSIRRPRPRPALVVGSGPGLEKNIHLIPQLEGRAFILSASSSYRPLLKAGIRPDLVVLLEGVDTSDYIRAEPHPGAVLTLASACHPNHFKPAGYHRTVFHTTPGAAHLFGAATCVPQAGTAGSAAFTLGLMFGLDPLILIGQDQAYGPHSLHARSAPGVDESAPMAEGLTVAGVGGRDVATHSGFASSLHWYAESVQYLREKGAGPDVINATESGAHIPGVPDIPLQRIVDRFSDLQPERMEPADLLAGAARPDIEEVHGNLLVCGRLVEQVMSIHERAPEQTEGILQECRQVHPFLADCLASLRKGSDAATTTGVLRRINGKIAMMREMVENHDR